MTNNLHIKTLILPLLVIVALICFVFSYFYFPFSRRGVDISGSVVDNQYNNFLAGGNLVRIEEKIYFNYEGNELDYGLIEISGETSRRIYWEGIKWFGANVFTHRIRQHNEQLIMMIDDQIRYYSTDTNTFEMYKPLNSAPQLSLCFQLIDEKLFYESAAVPGSHGNLCIYDGNNMKIIANNVTAFYVVGEAVYYYRTDETGCSGEFLRYSMIDQIVTTLCSLSGYYSIFSFVVEDNYLIFGAAVTNAGDTQYSIYKVNLSNLDKAIETVCEGNESVSDHLFDIRSWNVYNKMIYVATHNGLIAYDLLSNDIRQLYDKYTEECYIVDDTWIYFVNEKGRLWRVMQNGSFVEKVF